jgi:hypothetical protein
MEPLKFGPAALHWSHVHATGEEESSNKTDYERESQAGAYTAYHLQARPDFVSVPGILVGKSSFKLFFSNACRVYHTGALAWNTNESLQLLYAWMWRLYNPECDKTITVDMNTSPPTFTVVAGGTTYGQCIVSRAGESIGRRTIVFERLGPLPESEGNQNQNQKKAPDPPGDPSPNLDGSRKPQRRSTRLEESRIAKHKTYRADTIVIKEQYVQISRRFKEGLILEKIHQPDDFPGVVRLKHHEIVMNDGQEICVEFGSPEAKRVKIRLVLKDRGTPLEKVETMRELLMGVYDLLEGECLLPRLGLRIDFLFEFLAVYSTNARSYIVTLAPLISSSAKIPYL